jgi:hypothetical protein
VTSPTPRTGADVNLESVTAVSPAQVWAVGESATSTSPSRPYALRWNGRTWASVPVPNTGPAGDGRKLLSVAVAGHGQLAAVGYDNGPTATRLLHASWDGHRWSVTLGPLGTVLNAVAGDGGQLLAVGSKGVVVNASTLLPFTQVSP